MGFLSKKEQENRSTPERSVIAVAHSDGSLPDEELERMGIPELLKLACTFRKIDPNGPEHPSNIVIEAIRGEKYWDSGAQREVILGHRAYFELTKRKAI